jgi:hypothetical protein
MASPPSPLRTDRASAGRSARRSWIVWESVAMALYFTVNDTVSLTGVLTET